MVSVPDRKLPSSTGTGTLEAGGASGSSGSTMSHALVTVIQSPTVSIYDNVLITPVLCIVLYILSGYVPGIVASPIKYITPSSNKNTSSSSIEVEYSPQLTIVFSLATGIFTSMDSFSSSSIGILKI